MAKTVLTILDKPDGGCSVQLKCDDPKSIRTLETNTLTQNATIQLVRWLRSYDLLKEESCQELMDKIGL